MSTPTLLSQAQARLAESLAALPPDKTAAVVGLATTEGARIAVVGRFSHGWEIEGYIDKEWGGDVTAGCTVVKSW